MNQETTERRLGWGDNGAGEGRRGKCVTDTAAVFRSPRIERQQQTAGAERGGRRGVRVAGSERSLRKDLR